MAKSVSKKMSPEARKQFHNALRRLADANRRIRNLKGHGDEHNRVHKDLAKVLEKTWKSPKEWHMPKLANGKKKQYKEIAGQRVFYRKEGQGISLYKTTGKMIHSIPQHDPHPIRKYRRVEGTWLRIS